MRVVEEKFSILFDIRRWFYSHGLWRNVSVATIGL